MSGLPFSWGKLFSFSWGKLFVIVMVAVLLALLHGCAQKPVKVDVKATVSCDWMYALNMPPPVVQMLKDAVKDPQTTEADRVQIREFVRRVVAHDQALPDICPEEFIING